MVQINGLLLVMLLLALPVQAEVYTWVDEKGRVHYADTRPEGEDTLSAEIEIKNSQMQVLGEGERQLLERYEADREQRAQAEQERVKAQPAHETEVLGSNPLAVLLAKRPCFSDSPSMTASGLSYAEVVARELSEAEWQSLESFLQRARGRWRGAAQGFFCRGSAEAPRREAEEYELELEADFARSDRFELFATLKNRGEGITREERRTLHLKEPWLRFGAESAMGDVELRHLDRQGLTLMRKHWSEERVFIEVLLSIYFEGKELRLEQITYSNGALDHAQSWGLASN